VDSRGRSTGVRKAPCGQGEGRQEQQPAAANQMQQQQPPTTFCRTSIGMWEVSRKVAPAAGGSGTGSTTSQVRTLRGSACSTNCVLRRTAQPARVRDGSKPMTQSTASRSSSIAGPGHMPGLPHRPTCSGHSGAALWLNPALAAERIHQHRQQVGGRLQGRATGGGQRQSSGPRTAGASHTQGHAGRRAGHVTRVCN
jgi:hypothetical protein